MKNIAKYCNKIWNGVNTQVCGHWLFYHTHDCSYESQNHTHLPYTENLNSVSGLKLHVKMSLTWRWVILSVCWWCKLQCLTFVFQVDSASLTVSDSHQKSVLSGTESHWAVKKQHTWLYGLIPLQYLISVICQC